MLQPYDNRQTWAALQTLVNPRTKKIDLSLIYSGNAVSVPDESIRGTDNLNERYLWLKEALARPHLDIKHEEPRDIVLDKEGKLPSSIGYFLELCAHPKYSLFRKDRENLLQHAEKFLQPWLANSNLTLVFVGTGEKDAEALEKAFQNEPELKPKRVIIVDCEQLNLDVARKNLRRVFEDDQIISVLGDCTKAEEWRIEADAACRRHWSYLKRNGSILKALRNDPARSTVLELGATANDFPIEEHLAFYRDNFKPGSLFLQTYDMRVFLPALAESYIESDILPPWVVNAVAHTAWEKGFIYFDPRRIGGKVTVSRKGDVSQVRIYVGLKDNPKQRLPFDTIWKRARDDIAGRAQKTGMQPITKLGDDDVALWATCHPGHADDFRDMAIPGFREAMEQAKLIDFRGVTAMGIQRLISQRKRTYG